MQLRIFTLLALSMASLAAAKQAMVIKESVSAPPDWVRRGPAPDLHRINLQIALKQRDVSTLEQQLLDIADPDSVNYGKWLNQEQVTSYLQPAEASIGAVRRWLAEHGIEEKVSKRSVAGDWITADVTVSQARALLGEADFAVWEHRSTGEQLVRAIEYSLPRNVAEHVDLVGPTTYFSQIRALNKQGKRSTTMHWEPVSTEVGDMFSDAIHPLLTSPDKMAKATKAAKGADGVPKVCNLSAVSMDCLRQFYRSYDYKVQNPSKQRIGISGFSKSNLHDGEEGEQDEDEDEEEDADADAGEGTGDRSARWEGAARCTLQGYGGKVGDLSNMPARGMGGAADEEKVKAGRGGQGKAGPRPPSARLARDRGEHRQWTLVTNRRLEPQSGQQATVGPAYLWRTRESQAA
ncbi:hypothetical protein L7F22_054828 [Adiantum nelumboides]|nr:hypothetical protein [Adiantum nelumboides]